jgi:hypothetical protein
VLIIEVAQSLEFRRGDHRDMQTGAGVEEQQPLKTRGVLDDDLAEQ